MKILDPRAPPAAPKVTNETRVGAAKTPLPYLRNGILTGWGPFMWEYARKAIDRDEVPLFARALVVEDPRGHRLALVAVDLHGGSRYVTERAAFRLASLGFHAGNLFVSGTHNHAGPAGLYGSNYYDAFAASASTLSMLFERNWMALNTVLAEVVVDRIVQAVTTAVARLKKAVLGVSTVENEWARNRSLRAFLRNMPDVPRGKLSHDELLREVNARVVSLGLTPHATSIARSCVDSKVYTLAAYTDDEHRDFIGSFSTYGAHCSLLSRVHDRQSPDYFGHATHLAERELGPGREFAPVVALAAGSIGDSDPLAPDMTLKQLLALRASRAQLLDNQHVIARHARQLAGTLQASLTAAKGSLDSLRTLDVGFSEDRIAGATPSSGRPLARQPRIGVSTVAGSEFGTGKMNLIGPLDFDPKENEGREHRDEYRNDPLFPKLYEKPNTGPLLKRLMYLGSLSKTVPAMNRQHDRLGLRLARLSFGRGASFQVLGLPGEPTTWLAANLRQRLSAPQRTAMVVGVTGDYQGYFTTSLEYDTQQYEGGSTIWGRETQSWLTDGALALHQQLDTGSTAPPTGTPSFDCDVEDEADTVADGDDLEWVW